MAFGAEQFLKKSLGEDFLESLAKVELWKPGTRSTIDHEEIKTALKIVPRVVMALLIRELTPMQVGEHKDIDLPVGKDAKLAIDKFERDVYTGQITEENKFVVDFKLRSLPGVGLVILSAFEMYSLEALKEEAPADLRDDAEDKVRKIIDERLALHSLVNQVVDQRLAHKDAVNQLLMAKLTEHIQAARNEKIEQIFEVKKVGDNFVPTDVPMNKSDKKKLPLKDFLESRKNKLKKNEFEIVMVKGETVRCPDCGNALISGNMFTGCICLGDDREKKIFIKKAENGITVRFGRGWDQENIEMLLDTLRKKHG